MKRILSCILIFMIVFNMAIMTKAEKWKKITFSEGTQVLGINSGEKKTDGISVIGAGIEQKKVDEEHGDSLFLPYNKGQQNIGKWSKETLEGRYGIGFSMYAEEMTYQLILATKGKGSNSLEQSTGTYNMLRFTTDKNVFLHYDGNNDQKHSGQITNFESKRWYDIELWVDTVNKEFSYYIDGINVENIKWFEGFEEFHGFSIVNAAGTNASSGIYIDDVWFVKDGENNVNNNVSPVYVDIETAEKVVGNNYLKDKIPEFKVSLVNRLNKKNDYRILYFADDKKGNIVWQSDEETVSFEPYGKTEKTIKLKPGKYGVLNFKVRITDGERSYDKSLPFTYINRSSTDPLNKKLGWTSHVDRNRGTYDEVFELAKTGGFGLVRTNAYWTHIEKQKGKYSFSNPAADFAKKYGMDVLVVMYGRNESLYLDTICGGAPYNDEMEEELKQAVTEWVKLSDGRVKYVENWNEYKSTGMRPNISQEHYIDVGVRMHRAIYEGVKAADPNIKVYGFDEDSWAVFQSTAIDEMLQKFDGKDYWDGITLHLYPQDRGELEQGEADKFISTLRGLLEKYGNNKDTALACSELGWSNYYGTGISKERVAAYSVRGRAYILAKYNFDFDIDYNLYDYPEYLLDQEAGFGACEGYRTGADKVPYLGKEKFCALAYWNSLSADYQSMNVISGIDEEKEFGYHIKDRNGQDILMVGLTGEGNEIATYNLGCDKVIMTDMYGNEKTLYGIDGKFTVTLKTDEVTYLKGDFYNTQKTDCIINLEASDIVATVNDRYVFDMTFPTDFNGEIIFEDTHDVAQKIEFSKIINGKSNVTIISNPEFTETNDIGIQVVKDGKIYFDGFITVRYAVSGTASNIKAKCTGSDYSLWDIYFDIQNNSASNEIKGRVTETKTGISLKLPEIAPGEVRTVVFPYKAIKSIKDLDEYLLKVSFDNGEEIEIKNNKDHVFAEYAEKVPIIDGYLEKDVYCDNMLTLKMDSKDSVRKIADWGGVDDISAKAYLKYDLENLYIGVDVTDNIHKNEYTALDSWRGDSIQFAITMDVNYDIGTSFMIGLNDSGIKSFYMNSQEGNHGGYGGGMAKGEYIHGESAIKRDGSHTYYEMKLPWDKIKSGGGMITPGQELRFSMLINDNDGMGRRGWVTYGEGVGDGSNATAKFDKLILLKK